MLDAPWESCPHWLDTTRTGTEQCKAKEYHVMAHTADGAHSVDYGISYGPCTKHKCLLIILYINGHPNQMEVIHRQ